MKIETYNLEFNYFDGSQWKEITVKIQALTIFELMRAFINEVTCLQHFEKNITKKQAIKQLWNDNKKFIYKSEIIFPIITQK